MYQCFNGMNNVFPSSAPISPMYPMMNPNTVYAMQQTYQNRGMMMSPNMYTQMQVIITVFHCHMSSTFTHFSS